MKKGVLSVLFVVIFSIILPLSCWAGQPAVPEGFLDYGSDANNNGTFDHLSADVTVTAEEAGKYSVQSSLQVRKNLNEYTTLLTVTDEFTLSKGTQTVSINFPGERILKSKVNGPYYLSVVMSKGSWKYGGTLGETRAFKISEFEETDLVLTTSAVKRKSQAVALAQAEAQKFSIPVGALKDVTFNGAWLLVFNNSAGDPYKFVINPHGQIQFLGPKAEQAQAPQPKPATEPEKVVEQPKEEPKTDNNETVIKEEPSKEPVKVAEPQKEEQVQPKKNGPGKLDKLGGITVWPFILAGFVLFLLLGFVAEVKARFR